METAVAERMPQQTGTTYGLAQTSPIQNKVRCHCWYCNKPLYGFRKFCSDECREAIYEDTPQAKERRMILGCQC